MPESSDELGFRLPGLPDEELARDACVALIYHLLQGGSRMSADPEWGAKRGLLVADYARRSKELPPELQRTLDRAVISSFDANADSPSVTTLFGTLPEETKVDVALITILPEELKATLRAFGVEETLTAGQPFYRATVPCRGRPDRPLVRWP